MFTLNDLNHSSHYNIIVATNNQITRTLTKIISINFILQIITLQIISDNRIEINDNNNNKGEDYKTYFIIEII